MGLLDALFPPLAPLFTENHELKDAQYGRRERSLYKAYSRLLYRYGKWHQGINSDGAQYVGSSPFSSSGVACDNCVFYQPEQSECYIVEGDIAPGGFCKLWIIPDEVMA